MVLSTAQYRQKPVSQHDAEARRKYVMDLRRLHGSKMTKGRKVLVNLRGKNVPAVIMEDLKPTNTSVKININGKEMRKDLATIYGVEGMSDVEEAAPPSKLLQLKPKGPGTPRKLKLDVAAGSKKKISEGVPPKKATTPRKNGGKKTKSAGTPRKQAKNIDDEIKNLMAASDRVEAKKKGGKNYN